MGNTFEFVNADGLGDFGSSGNWIDETAPATPGPPGATDTALVETTGAISGTGNVGALVLDGVGGVLTSTIHQISASSLELEGRVALTNGSAYSIFGAVEQEGTSTVSMSGGSFLSVSPGMGSGATSFDVAVSSGDRSTFNLSGLGTRVELAAGNAVIGDAGIGAMTIGAGAELKTDVGGVTLGGTAGGQGTLTVTGPFSTLLAAGNVRVNQGAVSISGGAEASGLGLTVDAGTAGRASILVSGAGSRLIAGDAAFGGGAGVSLLTIANAGFAELNSLVVGVAGVGTNSESGTNSVLVEGAGSTLDVHGDLDLGDYALGRGGQFAHSSGSLTVTSGALVLQDSNGVDILGEEGSSSGTISVSGLGSTLNTGVASLIVGDDGTGTVSIRSGGKIISSTTSGPAVTVGHYDSGSVTVAGIGSDWAATGEFDVGYYGTGSVLVESGASLETGNSNGVAGFVVGSQAGGLGTATISGIGSSLTNSGEFVIGASGSGRLTVSAGAVVNTTVPSGSTTAGAIVGENAGSTGIVSVVGAGSEWSIGSGLTIGGAGTGTLVIGAGATVTAASLQVGVSGVGALKVSGASATMQVSGNATFGGTAKGSVAIGSGGLVSVAGTTEIKDGGVALSGGALSVSKTLTDDAGQFITGYGTVNASSLINSSLLQANGGTLSFIGGITGTGILRIQAASTLGVSGSVSSGQKIQFESATSNLVLGAPASFAGTIYDFIKGDTIDLSKIAASSVTYSGQTLTVHESGGASLALTFAGAYTQSSFGLASDGHSGTFITHS